LGEAWHIRGPCRICYRPYWPQASDLAALSLSFRTVHILGSIVVRTKRVSSMMSEQNN
jgi:hypothetical protein